MLLIKLHVQTWKGINNTNQIFIVVMKHEATIDATKVKNIHISYYQVAHNHALYIEHENARQHLLLEDHLT